MATCSNCKRKVAYDAIFCPGCGKQKPGEGNGCGGLIILAIIIYFVIAAGNNKESTNSKSSSSTTQTTSINKSSSSDTELELQDNKELIEENTLDKNSTITNEINQSNEIQDSDVLYEQGTISNNNDDKMQELIAKIGNGQNVKLDPKIMATLPKNPDCRIAETKKNIDGNSVASEGIYCLDPEQFKYIQVDMPAKEVKKNSDENISINKFQKDSERIKYSEYVNSKFSFSIQYPSNLLFPQGESDIGDGQIFLSQDAKIKLNTWGSFNTFDTTIEQEFNDESRGGLGSDPHKVVVYKKQKNNWFVVSGYRDTNIFYMKEFLVGDHFIGFNIEYPKSENDKWKPIVSDITSNFILVK